MMDSKITEMRKFAYGQAYLEDSISLIRRLEKKGGPAKGYLIVNSATTATPELSIFYCMCEVTPKEYKQILNKKRKLPKGWSLKEVLFDGAFVFDNLTDLLASLKEWPYYVAIEAQRKSGVLEFVCKSGRRWHLKLPGFNKKSSLEDFIDLHKLENINTKPEYKFKKNNIGEREQKW